MLKNAQGLLYSNATKVTTSDSAANNYKALYIGVAGAVVVETVDGTSLTFTAVPVGVLPISVVKVRASGTAATDIIGLN